MEFNRNQYLILGLVLLLLGLQIRVVESYVLNERTSSFVAERFAPMASADGGGGTFAALGPTPLRTIRPPVWLGYCLISVGAVLILHSLAMKKPGG